MKTLRFAVPFILALTACPRAADPVLPPPAAVVTSFTASTSSVATPGTMVTLRWETTNARRITLEHVGKGPLTIDATSPNGSLDVAITADSTFVLTAQGEGGTDSAVTAVALTGSGGGVLFDAAPRRIELGGSTTLVWNVPGATSVTIASSTGGNLDLRGQGGSGSVLVNPARNTRYTLTAGSSTANIDVVVLPVIFSFTSTPSPASGQPVTLTWSTGGGTRLTLTRDGATMPLLTEMTAARIAQGSFEDMPPALPVEGILIYRLELEDGANKTTSVLTVRVGGSLRITSFNVPLWVRPGFAIPVTWSTAGASYVEVQVDDVPVYVAPNAMAAAAGALPLPALSTGSQRVRLVARNDRGGIVSLERTVATVLPPVFNTFSANPTSVTNGGEPVVLTWDVTNARDVRITEVGGSGVYAATGAAVEMGTATVYPNRAVTTYLLQASNGAGQAITPATVMVNVANPARLTFERRLPTGATGRVTGHTVIGGTETYGLPVVAKNVAGDAFIDISGSGFITNVTGDTTATVVPLGETFDTVVFGRRVSSSNVSISPNGWLVFSDVPLNGATVPTSVQTNTAPLAIAPYLADLFITSGIGAVYARLDTVGSERRLIVQWTDVEDFNTDASRITFQAQVYSSGRIVFAYEKALGLPGGFVARHGVANGSSTAALADAMQPAVGETLRLFDLAMLPVNVVVEPSFYVARVAVGTGFVQVEGNGRLVPGEFSITEVNPRPNATLTNAEWIEVTNFTGSAVDLNGAAINFGGTNRHTITTSVIIPPNGVVVLAQSADLGDATAMLMAGYVYPATFTMPDTSGSVVLEVGGLAYSTATWSSASQTGAGISVRVDRPNSQLVYASGVTACSGATTGTYGLQTGTPGATHAPCAPFPYVLSQLPAANFEAIADGGTLVHAGGDSVRGTAMLTNPIQYMGTSYTSLTVSSDGVLSPIAFTASTLTNKSGPSTTAPTGTIAPFWDDLTATPGANVGMYWAYRDPDMMAMTGDEYTIVSWEGFRVWNFTAQNLNFQVKFFANGNIEFHYGAMTPDTSSTTTTHLGTAASVWLEHTNGGSALPIRINGTSYVSSPTPILPNTAYRFTYSP